ncbi:MAG: hypothetical protein K0R39_784 [Symbiobacteriaceae bacterium]|nr:hypothetical protein [Symbiobacteriaceae bacterium]
MVKRRVEKAENVGEQIMREFLSLLVDSDEYEDESAPGFLVNPLSGELLRYDRYYPPRVGVEFNGPQHYGPTDRYPDPQQAAQQQARDYMKIGLSVRKGMAVVVVHAEDLSLAGMRAKVEGLLPLRNLKNHGQLAEYLEKVGRRYRAKVAREGRLATERQQRTS